MRVLCAYFPRLAVNIALAVRPHLAGSDLIFVDGPGDGALVTAASARPLQRGVVTGMTAAGARRHCPGAVFLPDSIASSLDVLEPAADYLRLRVTPFVEVGGRDHLFAGLQTSPQDERTLATRVRTYLSVWTGLDLRIGVGPSRAAALTAAQCARAGIAVADGTAVSPQPVASWRDEPVSMTAHLRSSGDLVRAVHRLHALLAARGDGCRWLQVEVGSRAPTTFRSREPVYDIGTLRDWISGLVDAAPGPVRITAGGLVPDLRVRPYASTPAQSPLAATAGRGAAPIAPSFARRLRAAS